jgi:hypothetical protein
MQSKGPKKTLRIDQTPTKGKELRLVNFILLQLVIPSPNQMKRE